MKDIKDTIAELLKTGLEHSIAQTFLIFSGALVIVSLIWVKEFVLVSFLTLFYALINFKLEALRRHESLGRYAVGPHLGQSILFTLISISYFVWWIVSVTTILINTFTVDDINFIANLDSHYQTYVLLPAVGSFVIKFIPITAIILTTLWLVCIFYKKWRIEKNINGNYKAKYICKNCGSEEKEIEIPRKTPYWDHPCPDCGLYELKKKNEGEHHQCETTVVNNNIKNYNQLNTKEVEPESQKLKEARGNIAKYLFVISLLMVLISAIVLTFIQPTEGETNTIMLQFFLVFGSGLFGSIVRAKFIGRDIEPGKNEEKLKTAYYRTYPIITAVFSILILATFTHLDYSGWTFYASIMSIGFIVGVLGLGVFRQINIP